MELKKEKESPNYGGDKERTNLKTIDGVEEQRSTKNNVKGGRIILGLKLSRKRLHFLFKGHGAVAERWTFLGTLLADGQWHTLALAISSNRVRLTVDCNPPSEM